MRARASLKARIRAHGLPTLRRPIRENESAMCDPRHQPHDWQHHGKSGKTADVIIDDTKMKTTMYGNFHNVLSVCHSAEWWIDMKANVHVSVDIFHLLGC